MINLAAMGSFRAVALGAPGPPRQVYHFEKKLNNSFEDAGISYEDELYTCTYAGTLRVFAAALGL